MTANKESIKAQRPGIDKWFSSDMAEKLDFSGKSSVEGKTTVVWSDSFVKSGNMHRRGSSGSLLKSENVNPASTSPELSQDDIPVIPDIDDFQDDFVNQNVEPHLLTINRVTFSELNSDLVKRAGFSTIEDIDLAPLVKKFHLVFVEEELDEPWQWENIFSEVITEIDGESCAPKRPVGVSTHFML